MSWVTGSPTASLAETVALPSGLTFVDKGDGTGILSGTPSGAGTFTLTFTANDGLDPVVSQTFTLSIIAASPPAITSAAATTFQTGKAGSFTITTTGFPYPAITDGGATLPSGVSLKDNGNGTATLSGTPAPSELAKLVLERLNCTGCHERNGAGGLPTSLVAKMLVNQSDQNSEAVSPPPLTGVAGKLLGPDGVGAVHKAAASIWSSPL